MPLIHPVMMARRNHLYPCRTQKLSSLASMILGGRLPGKVERCRFKITLKITVTPLSLVFKTKYSSIAQLAEHAAVNRRVVRSSRTRGANRKRYAYACRFLLFLNLFEADDA